MNKLILFVLLFVSTSTFAQDDENYNYGPREGYHQFEVETEGRLLADHVNVREKPNTKAKVVANLPIGTPVKIESVSKEKLTLNGFEANWCQVSFKHHGSNKVGYVWAGLIADGFTLSKDGKTCFLYGVAAYSTVQRDGWEEEVVTAQVRACKDNKELDKIEFDAGGGLQISRWMSNLGDKGLDKVPDVIQYGVSQEMCAGFNAEYVIFWTGEKLYHVATLRPGADVPYYASDDLIFPKDKGGVKGKVIRDEQSGYYEEGEGDEEGKDVIESQKKVELVWTGTKLKQTKVLIDQEYEEK